MRHRVPRQVAVGADHVIGWGGLCALLSLAVCLCLGAAGTDKASRTALMATYIWKLPKFVEWPEAKRVKDPPPFVIGVLGEDPFRGLLRKSSRGKKVKGRRITLRRFESVVGEEAETEARLAKMAGDLKQCDALFICQSEWSAWPQIRVACKPHPILTFSDIKGFSAAGGMIEFVLVDKNLKFEIGRYAYEEARLRIAPKLLGMAVRVHRSES